MSHPPLLDEVSTECCCPERASFEPAAHSQREPPSFATVASSQRRDRRSPVFGSHAGADGEAAERVACRASRAHLLLEGRGVGPSMRGRFLGWCASWTRLPARVSRCGVWPSVGSPLTSSS